MTAPTPTAKLRSKTKIVDDGAAPPIWGFDGSSTNQAPGDTSDCVLKPVFVCPDPIRKGNNKLVHVRGAAHRHDAPPDQHARTPAPRWPQVHEGDEYWFGLEQEYTFFDGSRPLGFPESGFPAPQGGYYCGVGADEVFGRPVVEAHLDACLDAGLRIAGINAEVMPGQWEFQVGPLRGAGRLRPPVAGALAALPRRRGLRHQRHAGPEAGARRLERRRLPHELLHQGDAHVLPAERDAAEALKQRHDLHIANYGSGIEDRLTGLHETASYKEFSYGVSDRGASVRIPWQVEVEGKGYIEDRRPCANMDPYTVTRLIMETVSGQ